VFTENRMTSHVRNKRSSTTNTQDGVPLPSQANTTSAYFNRSPTRSPVNNVHVQHVQNPDPDPSPAHSNARPTAQHWTSPSQTIHTGANTAASSALLLTSPGNAKHSAHLDGLAAAAAAKLTASALMDSTYSPQDTTLTPIEFSSTDHSPATITDYLKKLNSNMETMNTSIAALRNDMTIASINHDEKLFHLEQRMESKYDELSRKIDTKIATTDANVTITQRATDSIKSEIDALRAMILDQQRQINELTETTDADRANTKYEVNEVLKLANNIENHQRRWAVRIVGLTAPTPSIENTDITKIKVLDFITNELKIKNVKLSDIDCAHRVGVVTDKGTQTILTRFFSRDLTQLVIKMRTILKGSDYVVYEDCSYLTKQLLREVKGHPSIESGWQANGGQVWGKLKNGGRKVKFYLGDNLSMKILRETPAPTQIIEQPAPTDIAQPNLPLP
jgi:hypothetical protein